MTDPTVLELRLRPRARELLSEYGYPFDDFADQLASAESVKGSCIVTIEPFYFDALLADLVRSAKEIDDAKLLAQIDTLYSDLENQAMRQGYRCL